MDTVIGIFGIISGFLCALADTPLAYFFDANNKKIGQRKDIQTGWQTASSKRFYLSFLRTELGFPGGCPMENTQNPPESIRYIGYDRWESQTA